MGKITKEQKLYLEGMQFALKIAKESGVDELTKEVTYRCGNQLPLNVNRRELTLLARGQSKAELLFVATSMAETLTEHLKMPPTIIHDYLKQFNKRIEEFRADPELYESIKTKLDNDFAMTEMLKNFIEEE